MSKLPLLIGLIGLAALVLAAWNGMDTLQTAQQLSGTTDGYAPAPAAYTNPKANSGGANFNFSTGNVATGNSPLVFAATSEPLGATRAVAAGIMTPTPLPAALTDDAILDSVQGQLAKLDPADPQPRFEHLRPSNRGELQSMGIVGPDTGDQVLVVVRCDNCNAKALVPASQDELRADYLTFVCHRHYAGCSVIAGKENDRIRQIRSVPNRAALPTVVPRRGVDALTVDPPFAR